MKLSAYLSLSRHGVFYFRWPLPRTDHGYRPTIKISLRTGCPVFIEQVYNFRRPHSALGYRSPEEFATIITQQAAEFEGPMVQPVGFTPMGEAVSPAG